MSDASIVSTMHTVRVPCGRCVGGYIVPWHRRDGKRYYRCVVCEEEMRGSLHHRIKERILVALASGEAIPRHFVFDAARQSAEARGEGRAFQSGGDRAAAVSSQPTLAAEEIAIRRAFWAYDPGKLRMLDWLEQNVCASGNDPSEDERAINVRPS